MAKLIGDISWELQPEYPQLDGEENNEQITVKFIAHKDKLIEKLPNYGSVFYDDRFPFFNTFTELRLVNRNVKTMRGQLTYLITLIYRHPPFGELMEEVEYQDEEFDAPIDTLPNYLVNWDHRLIGKGALFNPDWWATAKTTAIPEADAQNYKWIKSGDQVPDGWFEMEARVKKADFYKTAITRVIVTRKSTSKKKLTREAAKRFTKQTPPDTFGVSGDWLQGASSIRKEGQYWVQNVWYLNSKVVDPDFYS